MRKLIEKCGGVKLPVSCIANLCYLPEGINRGKKERTIYEVPALNATIPELESKYTFTHQKDLEWIFEEYCEEDVMRLKHNYLNYLERRYETIKSKFLQAVCI